MAYNNIYDWHDSVRKNLEKELKGRRETMAGWMDRVGGDEQHKFFSGRLNSGKPEGKRRVNREAYSQDFVDIYQKWGQKHEEELKKWGQKHEEELSAIWDAPKNPANEAWERQSKIKRDPNDITKLCKVRVE